MSPRRPSSSDKGKKTKPRRQPARYIIRVPGQIPQSAPIQAPSLARVPTPHLAGVTTPSTSIPSPHPIVVPTLDPTMVLTPPTSTPHPTVVPAPPTFTAHPTVVPAPATFTPNPTVAPAPPTSTPQPSHQGPSPVVEEFSTRLSQVRSEQGSCAEASEHNDEEDVIRTQCWVDVVGGKNKGRLYGTGELGKGYTAGRGIHKQQASSSSNAEEALNRLTQRLEERDQAYENLTRQFQNFQNLVMAFLPPDAQTRLQQQQCV
ncbi:hypothetical protein DEO72_LG8g2927 [Vigna unguiculata]|uniref:Uncharacterized protein n=1 Tax=Vigna unguiculata TaxID=3917 RepID=A0A4D6MTS8_VIGUN|nr:hypothetical protein DEO72_LG8g2927 [Vigna unguiculata]